MALVLAVVAVFVYARLHDNLDEGIDNNLRSRSADVTALVVRGGRPPAPDEEAFAQVLTTRGRVLAGPPAAVLSPAEAGRATPAGTMTETVAPPVEGPVRVLARRVSVGGRPLVVAVGQSLDDRDDALNTVLRAFLVGGGIGILAASAAGWLLAGAALSPVERMRRRAERVSLAGGEERLPLPAARDEIHRLGVTLNEMLARLRESFERERRFVADAGHEMRTPLAVLKAELETALRRGGQDPETHEALRAALAETDHLAQLADDLLLIARSADGRLPVRTELVDLHEVLEQARERFSDRAREDGRAIAVEAPPDLRAQLDPLRMRQALGNLVDNALRHGAGDIELSARRSDGGVVVDVRDGGEGFPPELRSRAFERFARGDAGRTRGTRGGSGLGLAIVAAIAEAHDGTAEIVDRDGAGATVRLRLPSGPIGPSGS